MGYVIVDTESSMCENTGLRVLVSLAYEYVEETEDHIVSVQASEYDIVQHPEGTQLDATSERIHGITPAMAQQTGKPLADVIKRFLTFLANHNPKALVGHDIAADANLLVSEAMRSGLPTESLRPLCHLICTKQLATGQCAIPLPSYLKYEHPCDESVLRMAGRLGCARVALYDQRAPRPRICTRIRSFEMAKPGRMLVRLLFPLDEHPQRPPPQKGVC